jgi:hypothetical protein
VSIHRVVALQEFPVKKDCFATLAIAMIAMKIAGLRTVQVNAENCWKESNVLVLLVFSVRTALNALTKRETTARQTVEELTVLVFRILLDH